jgi:L-cystine uptake protein TcyP (sodium:dicarboxylate symporter family)
VIPLLIVGLGISIPLTAVLIISIIVKLASGDNYQLDLTKLFKIYLGALLGWALVMGIYTIGVMKVEKNELLNIALEQARRREEAMKKAMEHEKSFNIKEDEDLIEKRMGANLFKGVMHEK